MIFCSCGLKGKDGKETFTTFPVLLAAIFSEKVSFAPQPAHFSISCARCARLPPPSGQESRFRFHSTTQQKQKATSLTGQSINHAIVLTQTVRIFIHPFNLLLYSPALTPSSCGVAIGRLRQQRHAIQFGKPPTTNIGESGSRCTRSGVQAAGGCAIGGGWGDGYAQ